MLRLSALALLAALLVIAPAHAQQSSRWRSEGGFSIDLGGWRVLDRATHADVYDSEVIIAAPEGDSHGEARCSVEMLSQPAPNTPSRALMNEGTRRLATSPTITDTRGEDRVRIDRIEVTEIDGVATLDVYGGFMSLDTVTRRFFLSGDSVVYMYTVSCSVSADDPAAVAAGHAIAASLRFD